MTKQILDILQAGDAVINPTNNPPVIDPTLISDNRSIRQRFASARMSMQIGERTVIKTMARMTDWRLTIQASESKRLRKTILDMCVPTSWAHSLLTQPCRRENRRQVSRLTEWSAFLTSERGLWPQSQVRGWQLDETEGPHRIRFAHSPLNNFIITDVPPERSSSRWITMPLLRTWREGWNWFAMSFLLTRICLPFTSQKCHHGLRAMKLPPLKWTVSMKYLTYPSQTHMTPSDKQLTEEVIDDKLRRIRHDLEPGDVIEAVATVARIVGVDSSRALHFGCASPYLMNRPSWPVNHWKDTCIHARRCCRE
jgi:hypothetical protein